MISPKRKITILLLALFCVKAAIAEDGFIDGVSEIGAKFKISKSEWPIAFRCKHWGGSKSGQFMFSIRKKKGIPLGAENSWLIFPDYTAYAGSLYRNGLDWRFDWTDRNTDSNFSVVIKSDGAGYYYNWSLADENGRMEATRSATCE